MRDALKHYLAPDLRSLVFACKGLCAVTLALAISMSLDLDKPFWAMVASMMLQARPEAGLVIEKAACLALGSTVGAVIAVLILDNLTPYPVLAIGALALCVAVTSTIASTMRHVNFVFATSLVSVTAILIVLFALADPANTSSGSIFMVIRARLSEVLVGASSSILTSVLLYPFKVQKVLETGMNRLRDLSLTHVSAILHAQSNPAAVHQQRIGIIALSTSINDDANAGRYELASNIDAALLAASNALTIVAWGQTIERILSDNPKRLSEMLARFVDHHAHGCSSLEAESLKKVSEALSAMHGACDSIAERSHGTQRFPRFNRHRDWLVGLRAALRSSLVFLSAIAIWILSGEQAALIMMIVLPALLSQAFSSHPVPRVATAKLLGGALIAIPIAIPVSYTHLTLPTKA